MDFLLRSLREFRASRRAQSTQRFPSGKVDFNDRCDRIF
jgi:hypothetical protein